MLEINLTKRAAKFLKKVYPKHGKQIVVKILALRSDPRPQDSKSLKGGSSDFQRVDSGEYRIIYRVNGNTLEILLVGKRNDDEVYKKFMRLI